MNFLTRLFKKSNKGYDFKILEYDDGDAYASFTTDNDLAYLVELDWTGGILDVEFGLANADEYDTTNAHNQYRILTTVSSVVKHVVKQMYKKTGVKIHSLEFKSSNWRNGQENDASKAIRDRFFIRYVRREYPNANVIEKKDGSILINLK